MRTLGRLVAASVALTALLAPAAAGAATPSDPAAPSGRVLVISLPAVTWEDLRAADVPNLRGLLEDAALADLAVRVGRLKTRPGDGYATVGAGTRAVAPASIAGLAFRPDEPFENGTAADVFLRRTGRFLDGDVGHLRLGTIQTANDEGLFGGEVGVLGDALRAGGVDRGVVANADWTMLAAEPGDYHREAALGLMGRDGVVPCGDVGKGLLVEEPSAPFGVRLSTSAVVEAFSRCWHDHSVVLVEASDLRRAEDYRTLADREQRSVLLRKALEDSDELVGALLEQVDLRRDAVVVVAPSSPEADVPRLTAFAVRAPGVPAALLESSSTRQPGFVSIVDVAPTIAELAGAPLQVDEIDGRAVTIAERHGSYTDRVETLVDADADARFRDRMIAPTVTAFITLQVVLGLGVIALLWRQWGSRRALELGSLAVLGALPLTYLAALLPMRDWGAAAYVAFVFGGGLVLGLAADALRRRWLAPLAVMLGLMLAVTAVSVVLLGSRLQLSTVFGDSPIIAGRFSGINNVTFSQVVVAAILLSVFLVHRFPGRWGVTAMVTLLGAVLLIDGVPMWGADVGGVLALVPAFALTASLLAGWRVRVRTVLWWGGATLLAVGALGALDLTRDPAHRTHLGRLFERVGSDGWSGLRTVVRRKLDANLKTLTDSAWRFILVPVLALAVFVGWKAPGEWRGLRRRVPELRAGFLGLLVAAVLGYALNDSGIAVPGMMLAVLNPAAIYLLMRLEPPAVPATDLASPPAGPVPRTAPA